MARREPGWAGCGPVACNLYQALATSPERAALAHLLRADTQAAGQAGQGGLACPDQAAARAGQGGIGQGQAAGTASPGRLAEAQEAAVRLAAAGHRVSRRTLRTAGLHGSNADLGALARIIRSQLPTARAGTGKA